MPIVNLARGFHIVVVLAAFVLHMPWLIAIDFLFLAAGLLGAALEGFRLHRSCLASQIR